MVENIIYVIQYTNTYKQNTHINGQYKLETHIFYTTVDNSMAIRYLLGMYIYGTIIEYMIPKYSNIVKTDLRKYEECVDLYLLLGNYYSNRVQNTKSGNNVCIILTHIVQRNIPYST